MASAVALAVALPGCKKESADPVAAATLASAQVDGEVPLSVELSRTARLASIAMQTNVYAKPSDGSKKIGYLRLGAIVPRSDRAYGTEGCPDGWYGIAPRGFVCIGKTATLEVDTPLVKAASLRPDTGKALPYPYGFVRAVAPLYLETPSMAEQLASEFHLENHLRWWERRKGTENKVAVGANDKARELFADAPVQPPSDTLGDGVLFGGKTDGDPPPFWLAAGQRGVPNVSGFEVPSTSIFANRVRRHTGLAFIGAFDSGPEGGGRRFAVTVDMRLLPIDKVKPETASGFHGVDLKDGLTLPVAFAKPCNPNAKGTPLPCRHTYRDEGGTMKRTDEVLATRALLPLTGVQRRANGNGNGNGNAHATRFLQTKSGTWLRASDVGVAIEPPQWPQAAQRGERWIDVSIEDQTLILWEGKSPVFATLVSTGQDGLGDPKTTKSTPLGTYRIKSKHITATMDSNERSAHSGGAAPDPHAGESATADDKHAGQFELRDVPYVQYFNDGYALHSAYWHDHFGLARSHGCVNLAPIDALRVFRFTDPPVPEGWHGTTVEPGKGTSVVIHK